MMSSRYQTILTGEKDGNLDIVLNRPEKRNALNDLMISELKDIFKSARNINSVKTITIRGAGKAFCSGADLNYLRSIRDYGSQKNLEDSLNLAELFLLIYSHPKPTLAIVHGAALAGGCGLAGVCDFVLAYPEARFGYPEVKIGFIAALVSVFLTRQIGERKAKELLLSGKILSVEEAYNYGLVNYMLPEEIGNEIEKDILLNLHSNSSEAMTVTKQLFSNFTYAEVEKELNKVARINAEFRENDDFLEGISSFLEKRKPHWTLK